MIKKLSGKKIVMMTVSDFTHDSRILKEGLSAQKAGLKVTILAHKSFETKSCETIQGLRVIRVETIFDRFLKMFNKGQLADRKRASLPGPALFGRISMYASLIDIFLVNRLFVKETERIKPVIIHANDAPTLLAAYRLKKKGYKVVLDVHEFFSEILPKPFYFWKKFYVYLEKRISRLDGIFSVCQGILNEFNRRYGIKAVPQAVLYNTPPYKKSPFRVPGKNLKLIYVGRNLLSRDLSKIYGALKKLPGVTLTNIGPGWDKGKNKTAQITNLSALPFDKLIPELNKYDIGIIPYIPDCLNNSYSTPNKFFEYMMAGLAVASSDLVEIRRIIGEADNGVLFNPTNSKDIAEKIKTLMTNREKLSNFKKNSLKIAKKYCWENQGKKLLAMYRKILNQ